MPFKTKHMRNLNRAVFRWEPIFGKIRALMKRLIAFAALVGAAAAFAADVTEVRVKALDGFGGDTSFVSSRCQVKAGKPYDPVTVTRDVTSLKDSGEFEDITADAQRVADGVEVTYYVKRKMRYAGPLVIEGNEELSESKIASEAGLKDGYLYGESDLAAAAARVRLAYQERHGDRPPLAVHESSRICTNFIQIREYSCQFVDRKNGMGTRPVSGLDRVYCRTVQRHPRRIARHHTALSVEFLYHTKPLVKRQ